ncbi:hypothetical protein BCR34DRAFT_510426 [Clohesyomyces aquaticus]|uniref:Methyltransferase domain-containing protein n=1 Tax=Clohesyomyces aquaticus TaxID=1231657 RepID=A0A1Y1ZUL8_9PLEO|nr:hypothetical protein BCR34DRAFT_510426 [Clohesyomyces aquaticus]
MEAHLAKRDFLHADAGEADREPVQDTYRGPRHDGEYKRLRAQHDMIKNVMNGKLVLAPVDLSKPDLAVLDSATADGYWLQDLATITEPTATLVGADIAPQHFLRQSELSANIALITHNIFDPWPMQYHNKFDLVHQRFVLPVCSEEKSVDVIQKLFACVKPGGWIMLHDADFNTIEEGPSHGAMERLRDVLRRSWNMIGFTLSPGPKIFNWFKELDIEDVHEEILHIRVGAAATNRTQGEAAIVVLLAALEGIQMNMGSMPGYFFPEAEFSRLKQDLEDELESVGNSYYTHVVWGRKSASLDF